MSEIVIRQSVFDRLIGADLLYEGGRDTGRVPDSAAKSIALLKRNLLRDLGWLLNARQISGADEMTQENLRESVYTFGLRELSAYSTGRSTGPDGLQASIIRAIERHEPRLRNIQVTPLETKDRFDRLVSFHIAGDLLIKPDTERIEFDTVLKTATRRFEVRENIRNE